MITLVHKKSDLVQLTVISHVLSGAESEKHIEKKRRRAVFAKSRKNYFSCFQKGRFVDFLITLVLYHLEL